MSRRQLLVALVGLLAVCTITSGWSLRTRRQPERPGPLDPLLPVLLREKAKGDGDQRSPFFKAFSALAGRHRLRLPWYRSMDEGYAVEAGAGRYVVAILRGWNHLFPGENTQHLVLFDREGRVLDRVSCEINGRLTRLYKNHSGTFHTEVLQPPARDGAELVIGYKPEAGGRMPGNWGHDVTHGGVCRSFHWEPDAPGRMQPEEWERQGLCRVAVRGGTFVVLFPTPGMSYRTSRP
jgi:hypothetical protein